MTVAVDVVGDPEPTWLALLPERYLRDTVWGGVPEYAHWYTELLLSPFAADPGDPAYPDELKRIVAIICDAYETLAAGIAAEPHFLHFPTPADMPISLHAQLYPMAGETVEMLRRYVGADQGAEASVIETPTLGSGLRTVVPVGEARDREVLTAVATYAFRVEEHRTDVRIQAVSQDFGLMLGALGDIDAFVRCLGVG